MAKVRWGILSTARIGMNRVIPGMQACEHAEIVAIASRDAERAGQAAQRLGIAKAYGSYEQLLADKEVDAIYNPLPNHLHVPLTLKAIKSGKHVLCEKPFGTSSGEVKKVQAALRRFPRIKVMEAFMFRFHPQWEKIRALIDQGVIGTIRHLHSTFAYHNVNPDDIRNRANMGGGGMLDIGCYCISFSRLIYKAEPQRACGMVELDPRFKTDRLASAILEFRQGTASFSCSTQAAPYQRAEIFGTTGRIEIEIPFTPPLDQPSKIVVHSAAGRNEITFGACDQYALQGEAFSQSILNHTPVPTPLSDALANMKVIDAVVASSRKKIWIRVP